MARILTRYNMFPAGGRVGVAVSGGADSVVLLNLLHRLRQADGAFSGQLYVLHMNHHLRGIESDQDEVFVRTLAAALGLDIAVQGGLPSGSGNLEQEARLLRRRFFLSSMQEHGLQKLALGHTRSDQAETVLFRFLRGSGLAGLAGMQPATEDGLVRPLLSISREEIRSWAQTEGVHWREDSSNKDSGFARNRLRNHTIPTLTEAYNPNLEVVLAGMARLAQAEEDYWHEEIESIYTQVVKPTELGSFCKIGAMFALHMAVRRRLIRRAVAGVKGDLRGIDLEHIDAVLALCQTEQGHDRVLIPGVDALRSFGDLLLTQPGKLASRTRAYRIEVEMQRKYELPFNAGSLYVNWVKSVDEICANFKEDQDPKQEVVDLDWDSVTKAGMPENLAVRNWEPGDEILRPGHKTAEKIKTLFQECRVLLWERRHWPVLEVGREIVWARQFGCAAKFNATRESTRVVRLVYGASAAFSV